MTAGGATSDGRARGQLSVLAPAGSTLARALEVALTAHGWSAASPGRTPGQDDGRALGRAHLVVAEDDAGTRRVALPTGLAPAGLVVVASVASLAAYVPLVDRGALVVDRSAPFLTLVRLVDEGLRGLRRGDAEYARRRVREHTALLRLTAAERDTLWELEHGLSAAAIAALTQHSLHTVRSHIRSVLAKLGVSSQLAAVAVARRAGPDWHVPTSAHNVRSGDLPTT